MRYVLGVALPFLLQSLLVFIVIELNTGNGSWAGLAALLIGMLAIPATAIVNVLYLRARRFNNALSAVLPCYAFALVVPFLTLLCMLFG